MKPSIFILFCVTLLMIGSCNVEHYPVAPQSTDRGSLQFQKVTPTDPTVSASSSITSLWPPNHKMHIVTFSGQLLNYESASYTVTDGDGNICYSGSLSGVSYTVDLALEAARDGKDKNGRVYTFTASAFAGSAVARVSAFVTVDHN